MASTPLTKFLHVVTLSGSALLITIMAPLLLPQSSAAFAQLSPLSLSSGCMQSPPAGWSNTALPLQLAPFTATYDATPGAARMNGVLGFSSTLGTRYEDLAAIVRFSDDNSIEVMNGTGYSADVAVRYRAGVSYHFRFVINPVAQTYDVYVTPAGASEISLASGYGFHVTALVSFISNWAMTSDGGPQLTVCNMALNTTGVTSSGSGIGSGVGIPVALPLVAVPPVLSFGGVSVGSTGTATVGVTNSGSVDIAVTNISIAGAGFSVSGISTGQVVGAGQTAQLNLAFAPAGSGGVTGTITLTTSAGPTVIAVSGSGLIIVATHSVSLSWNASPSNVVGYNVYRGMVKGGSYVRLNAVMLLGTSYLDGAVQSGQTYFYVATAVDGSGAESVFSAEATASIP